MGCFTKLVSQIFDACHISETRVSAPTIFFVFSTTANLFGAEIRVSEIRQASKISPSNLVVTINQWLILFCKIWLYLKLVKHQKQYRIYGFQICAYIFSGFSGCGVNSSFANFHFLKVAKYVWDPCCHLKAETGSRFSLQEKTCLHS